MLVSLHSVQLSSWSSHRPSIPCMCLSPWCRCLRCIPVGSIPAALELPILGLASLADVLISFSHAPGILEVPSLLRSRDVLGQRDRQSGGGQRLLWMCTYMYEGGDSALSKMASSKPPQKLLAPRFTRELPSVAVVLGCQRLYISAVLMLILCNHFLLQNLLAAH